MHRAFDHRGPARMVGPADGTARFRANGIDGRQIGFFCRCGIGRNAMQQRDIAGARTLQNARRSSDFRHRRHAGRQHHRQARGRTGTQQRRDQQFIRCDFVEIDEGQKLRHRFQIKGCAGKGDAAAAAMLGNRRQMFARQFPFLAGAVLFAARENFRREHALDTEKLKFHRIAFGIGGGIDKGQCTGQIARMIAGDFGDKARHARRIMAPHIRCSVPGTNHVAPSRESRLTISKFGLAKRALTPANFR